MGKNTRKNSVDKVPRPKNCFILFRLDMQSKVSETCPGANHRDISRIIAKWWREASATVHKYYQELAKQEKIQHAQMYPNYKFNPVRKTVATRPYRKRALNEFTSKDIQKNEILEKLYNEERTNVVIESLKKPVILNVELASPDVHHDTGYLSPSGSQLAYSDSLSDSAPTYSPSACSYGEYVHSPYIAPKEEELKYPRYSCAQSCSEMKCDHTPHEVMQRQSTSIPSLNQNMYPESSTNSSHSRSYVPNHNIPSIPNYYKPSQVPRFDYDPGYYTANAQHLLVPYSYPNYTYTNQVTQSDLSQLPVDYINYNYYDQYQYKQ